MTMRYAKTEAGRQAIRDRTQVQLSRPARNLLLIIDSQKSGLDWVGLVNGSTEADLQQLIDGGLVELVSAGAGVRAAAMPVPGAGSAAPEAPQLSSPPQAPAEEPAQTITIVAPGSELDDPRPLTERLQTVGYRHLYDTMTAQARPLLGLIKGYRMVLEVERCSGPDELRRLAQRFIDEVRSGQGVGAAYRITEDLCRSPA